MGFGLGATRALLGDSKGSCDGDQPANFGKGPACLQLFFEIRIWQPIFAEFRSPVCLEFQQHAEG